MESRKRKRDNDEDGALRDLLTNWPSSNLADYQRELAATMRARFVEKSVAPLERLTNELEMSSPFSALMARASQRATAVFTENRAASKVCGTLSRSRRQPRPATVSTKPSSVPLPFKWTPCSESTSWQSS